MSTRSNPNKQHQLQPHTQQHGRMTFHLQLTLLVMVLFVIVSFNAVMEAPKVGSSKNIISKQMEQSEFIFPTVSSRPIHDYPDDDDDDNYSNDDDDDIATPTMTNPKSTPAQLLEIQQKIIAKNLPTKKLEKQNNNKSLKSRHSINNDLNNNQSLQITPSDVVYKRGPWDGSPIVIESHKLVFFTIPKVGCTVFKQLFRRMLGIPNWSLHIDPHIPHNPKNNQLTYLYHYNIKDATEMMTSPEWTRAIFVREPKQRVLSAYMDKIVRNGGDYVGRRCCKNKKRPIFDKNNGKSTGFCNKLITPPSKYRTDHDIRSGFPPSFESFLIDIIPDCIDPHWQPQANRIESKYWPFIDFVGHFETMANDTERLLKQIGAWEEYGKSGWTETNGPIFSSNVVSHRTFASSHFEDYFSNNQELIDLVHEMYYLDYNHPSFGYNNQ